MKTILLLLIYLLGLLILSGMGSAHKRDCQAVQNDIDRLGPKRAVENIRSTQPKRWQEILDRIENGQPQWLWIASKLRSGADAAATTELNFSVARALPKAPEEVLRLTRQGFAVEEVCTSPFIEPDLKTEKKYLLDARKTLAGVSSPDLAPEKKTCSAIIDSLLSEVSGEEQGRSARFGR